MNPFTRRSAFPMCWKTFCNRAATEAEVAPYLEGGIPQHMKEHREQVDLGSIVALQVDQSAHAMGIPRVAAYAQSFAIQGICQLALQTEATSHSAQAAAHLGRLGAAAATAYSCRSCDSWPSTRPRHCNCWLCSTLHDNGRWCNNCRRIVQQRAPAAVPMPLNRMCCIRSHTVQSLEAWWLI